MQTVLLSVHRITWHKGAIPEDEVWIKLGGDKGGGTFKMCFQHLNPNAPENTCVFSISEAPDTYTNLQIGLKCHVDDIVDLESHRWRHCCLWRLIKQDQLSSPPAVRGPVTCRTVESIVADHQQFNLKDVKKFNNCLKEPFFPNFSLSQVLF